MTQIIQFRRGTASAAASSNAVLAAGEPGYETDTGVLKVGDGTTAWNDLDAVTGAGAIAVVNIGMIIQAGVVDGTENTIHVCKPNPSAAASGDIPAGYEATMDFDLATVQGLLSAYFPDGANFLVLSGGLVTVYFLTAANITEPWQEVQADFVVSGDFGLAIRDGDEFEWVTAEGVLYNGSGIMAGIGNVGRALGNLEGYLDNERHVRGYFMDPVPSTLFDGPVADEDQPVTDDGQQIVKGDFAATLGNPVEDDDPDHWIAVVDVTTGQWGWVPSTGPSTPVGAASWANAITTNALTGGSKIVCRSGAMGVFMGYRAGLDHIVRGGPSKFLVGEPTGEWVINDPTA